MAEQFSREEWLKIDLFTRLHRSRFRMRFTLKEADLTYIEEKGMEVIRTHAEEIVRKRLAPAMPKNDGKQTPMRGAPKGHPVFLAMHATATCCRGCLSTWHNIPEGSELSEQEIQYIVKVILYWIEKNKTREY